MIAARSRLIPVLLAVLAGPLSAQGSPNVPLDDPRLPLVEFLIMRGAIQDPSPMHRPFRRADLVASLERADSTPASDSTLVRTLLAQYRELEAPYRYAVGVRGGFQATTTDRYRDLMHPEGNGGIYPYADVLLEGVFGPVVVVSRPALEPRITDDPDWPGRTDLTVAGRMVEAYLGLQFKTWGRFWFGQFDQNWGPVNFFAVPLSNFSYPRNYFGLDVGSKNVRLMAQLAKLRDETDSLGQVISRYHFMHRLGIQFSPKWYAALWETTVWSGVGRGVDGSFINPAGFLLLANQYGEGDKGNIIIGADVSWRVAKRATIQVQLALDDLQIQSIDDSTSYPNRWAFTVTGFGALGKQMSWQALYSQASNLAFRTSNPSDNFQDAGVGLGRGYPDMDYLSLSVSIPVMHHWMISPDAVFQRQGPSRITDPAPTDPDEIRNTPAFLSQPIEYGYRLGVVFSGRQGPFDIQGSGGLYHVTNEGNIVGASDTRFVGKIQALLRIGKRGVLK
jgi:hypothetical protein